MHNEDSVFTEIIVPAPEVHVDEEQPVVEVPEAPLTVAELVAIYSLLKAGYVPEDFQS